MLKTTALTVLVAIRRLLSNWRGLGIMTVIYALLLAGLYIFVTTKEATPAQVFATIALAIACSVLLFILLTGSASYTRSTARHFLFVSIRNFWKLLVVSIPVLAILVLLMYGLNKIQAHLPLNTIVDSSELTQQTARPSTQWAAVALRSARYLLFGLVAPLALIRLWISAANKGLVATFKRIWTDLTAAFEAPSVLIYMAGFTVFAVVPYFLLFKISPTTGAWREIGFLAARLGAVFCSTLLGSVITIGALSLAAESAPAVSKEA